MPSLTISANLCNLSDPKLFQLWNELLIRVDPNTALIKEPEIKINIKKNVRMKKNNSTESPTLVLILVKPPLFVVETTPGGDTKNNKSMK